MSLHRTSSPTTELTFGSDMSHTLIAYQPEINNNNNSPQYPHGISFTTSMPSASTSKTDLSYHEKRTAHNALERQRREGLNVKFQELAHVLPGLQQVRRPSKSMIVSKSLEFVSTAFKRESDFKGQLSTLKKENEQLLRQADLIKKRIRKRKQKMANTSTMKMRQQQQQQKEKSENEKSPSIESLKSDEGEEHDEDAKSVESNSNSRSVSIEKKSPSANIPTPKLVIRPRRTSSNLKAQVRGINLPTKTKVLIDSPSFSPPSISSIKRQREGSDSPVDPSTIVNDEPFFPTTSYSSPPPFPPTSSSLSASSSVYSSKRRRRSSGSNTAPSSSSFVSPPALARYQGPIRPGQFMVNPMVNVLPLSSSSALSSSRGNEASISSSSPQSSNSDFQFDISSLGTEQTFYSYDNQNHSGSTISAIPAVRMPIVNNDMPSNTYVNTDFLTSAILEDPEDHLFSWDN